MTQDDERLNEIASLLARLAPDGSKALKFAYRAVGSSFEQAFIPDGMAAAGRDSRSRASIPCCATFAPACTRTATARGWRWTSRSAPVQRRRRSRTTTRPRGRSATRASTRSRSRTRSRRSPPPKSCGCSPRRRGASPLDGGPVLRPGHGGPVRPHDFSAQDDLESALPDGLDGLFTAARERLLAVVPREDADRFLVGRLADGCWSVVHAPPAWAAVRMENGESVEKHAYAGPVAAVAFAAGAVLAGPARR